MNALLNFFTDAATLAIFDPARLAHRMPDDEGWWFGDFADLPEVQAGAIALISLGGDGVYKLRVTDGDLTCDERDYAAEVVRGLGVEVVSRRLYAGPGECVSCGDADFTAANAERGVVIETENGDYDIDVYAINWVNAPQWWIDDRTVPDNGPADFVAVVRSRTGSFPGIDARPRFVGSTDGFLFESSSRRVGPEPGMILTTTVCKGAGGQMALRDCGPGDYGASLWDYSDVAWRDKIRLKVENVDHAAKTLVGRFIEKA